MEILNTGSNADITVLDQKAIKKKYPEARIIVLDDDFNTFEHVANCLETIILVMSRERAWKLNVEVRVNVRQKHGEDLLNR